MQLPSVVLWDVGGTLVDYALSQNVFLGRVLQRAGISPDALDMAAVREAQTTREALELSWRDVQGEAAGYRAIASQLLRGAEVTDGQVDVVAAGLADYYDLYKPVAGIRALLDELTERGVPQGVVSNWPPSLKVFLKHHDVHHHFQVIMASGEQGIAKPDTELFERALTVLGVTARECVYIGDNRQKDIQPALSLGMQAIHFNPRRNHPTADAVDVPGLRSRLGDLGLL